MLKVYCILILKSEKELKQQQQLQQNNNNNKKQKCIQECIWCFLYFYVSRINIC